MCFDSVSRSSLQEIAAARPAHQTGIELTALKRCWPPQFDNSKFRPNFRLASPTSESRAQLQLHQDPQDAALDARHGRWRDSPAMGGPDLAALLEAAEGGLERAA
jgi:hypothetical protein